MLELWVSTLKHYFRVLCLGTSLHFNCNDAPSFSLICVLRIKSVAWVSPPFWRKCILSFPGLSLVFLINYRHLDPYKSNFMEITFGILLRFDPNFIVIKKGSKYCVCIPLYLILRVWDVYDPRFLLIYIYMYINNYTYLLYCLLLSKLNY